MSLESYLPILLFILVGIGVGVGPMVLGKLIGPSRPDDEKLSPYECGFEAFENARMQFDVRYYLVAILLFCSISKSPFFFPGQSVLIPLGSSGFFR